MGMATHDIWSWVVQLFLLGNFCIWDALQNFGGLQESSEEHRKLCVSLRGYEYIYIYFFSYIYIYIYIKKLSIFFSI
jgi:hypothetical protein